MFGDIVDTEPKPGAARIPTPSPNPASKDSLLSDLLFWSPWGPLCQTLKCGRDAFTAMW